MAGKIVLDNVRNWVGSSLWRYGVRDWFVMLFAMPVVLVVVLCSCSVDLKFKVYTPEN